MRRRKDVVLSWVRKATVQVHVHAYWLTTDVGIEWTYEWSGPREDMMLTKPPTIDIATHAKWAMVIGCTFLSSTCHDLALRPQLVNYR